MHISWKEANRYEYPYKTAIVEEIIKNKIPS